MIYRQTYTTPIVHNVGSSANSNTVSVNLGDTTGAAIIIAAVGAADTVPITDTYGNTYVEVVFQLGGSIAVSVQYASLSTGPFKTGAGHTLSISHTGAKPGLAAAAFAGALNPTPLNKSASAGGSGITSQATGSVTPDEDNELIIAALGTTGTPTSFDSGMTTIDSAATTANAEGVLLAYKVQTTATAINPTGSVSGSASLAVAVATFKVGTLPPQSALGLPPVFPPFRPNSLAQSESLALTVPPVPPPISSYGHPPPLPIFPKSAHATLGGFLKRTDPWTVPDFSSALIYITVNGVLRTYGFGSANGSIDSGSLTITDILDQTPNTAQFVARGFTPTVGMRVVMALGGIDNPSRLFAGTILMVNPVYVGTPGNQAFHVHCIDDTWLLNKRKVIKTYTSQSASAIAQDLLQTYAPGFTWRHIQPGLATIDTITFTNTDLTDCFTQLAKRIGAYWRIDSFDDLWFGLTESDGTQPIALTSTHGSLADFSSTTDLSQLVTRCFVEGGGVNAISMVSVGDTILPVQATDAWYNPLGGTVVCGTQRITYTGLQMGGGGSLVGPGFTPGSAPTLALAAGAGVETGAHGYATTFVTASGETLPGPTATITTGSIPIPTIAPTLGVPSAGTGPDTGDHGYAVSFVNAAGETTIGPIAHVTTTEVSAPSSAPVFDFQQFGTGPTLNGTQYVEWAVTFISAAGETTLGTRLAHQFVAFPGPDTRSIHLTSVPLGPAGTTSRKLYRTIAAAGTGGTAFLTKTIADNSTTAILDDTNDGSLGAAAPSTNSNIAHVVGLSAIPLGDPSVTARNIYRTVAGGATYKLAHQIADNTTTTWSDTVTDASLGATAPSSNTATANRVSVSTIQVYSGSGTVTQRKLYRTVAGGTQLKLLTTIADNSTTTYADSTADASLGANVPVSDTSGLPQSSGVVNAGSTTLLSAGVAWASASGGWAVIVPGTQVIRYTGISGNTLTGIPASGAGAIVATISYNSTITAAPCLTGIPASSTGSILYAINKGDPVNLLVQVDDTDAQAILSALLDPTNALSGGAGIREDYIQDNRLSEIEARARGTAQLDLLSRVQTSVTYTCRDPLTASGRDITINLPAPTSLSAVLKIQQVMISNFSHNAGLMPTYSVQASTVRFSFEDLLRQTRNLLNG